KKSRIVVGSDAPQQSGTYIQFGTSSTVYLVETSQVDSFLYNPLSLISNHINESGKLSSYQIFKSITLSGSRFDKPITIKNSSDSTNFAQYLLTTPVSCFAGNNSSNYVNNIRGLLADSVEYLNPTAAKLKSYGLDNPYVKVHAVYPDVTIDLSTSKPANNYVYMMQKGTNIVYKIATSKIPWVSVSMKDLLVGELFHPKLPSLSSINISSGGKSYTFKLGTAAAANSVTINGKTLDYTNFLVFFANLTYPQITQLEQNQALAKSSNKQISITYSYTNGKSSDTVTYYSDSSIIDAASVNGQVITTVSSSYVSHIMNDVVNMAANKTVSEIS
ncbi:MAG: DUF4340 domain-containing protein, partial [Bacillota bacterium]|nr:DUF4340 domain-containing protein [Bacillota bacterium]